MNWNKFVVVGENIHCTRIVKRNGKRAGTRPDGSEMVTFSYRGEERELSVPADWEQFSPAFGQDKIKHAALAIFQARHGDENDRRDGEDYLCWMAERQIEAGVTFLDVNVDEYANDADEVRQAMVWLVEFLSTRFEIPLSIDSSNPDTLEAGLERCRKDIRPPMMNSVSLERTSAVDLVKPYDADVIVSAAGREDMPADADARLANLGEIIAMLEKAGVPREKQHLDPLVMPISTDPMNGSMFMEATERAGKEFPGVHLNGGLSNISFGMPKRRLLNQVFMRLCAERGTDGGIIDPVTMSVDEVSALDPSTESFKLAKAVLTGKDMFGMEYISAYREGRL